MEVSGGNESNALNEILRKANDADSSDVHLVSGHAPMIRAQTIMQPLDMPTLTGEDMWRILASITNEHQRRHFEQHLDLDFSYEIPGFRRLPRGLVLVTGDTGSGKSTTLAAMIQAMNERYRKHIITLEDPVEYTFQSQKCLIEQRELGADMPTFGSGLKHALRQDPDIILVGEMRDLDTTALAITAAETGHLVLSTLHTVNASQTVERIVDMYPANQQNQIRAMLANTLQAVISQTLFRRIDKSGMVPAIEVMLCTPAIRNIIREARTYEIPNVIETSRSIGMTTLDNAIAELYFNGMISREDAVAQAAFPDKLDRQLAA